MRFHKIEMSGFKSFVDKTTITFEEGMTAVVGPNGCGKSNISDAIRWVLGEKSAKNMRGEKMEDVIFNGSELRKPHGMAEVSLTLQNLEGEGNLGFTEFKEITITRRLYRDGESEYLINKIPCRLKDIRDLLFDTGVGSKAYSIIEQGKIGQIISSKPEERRFIIEEVAGITKYKTRKNEALSKLKETEDNLSRVNDIVHEVKRQIGSLDRQAKKAERYKKLSLELRDIELKMAWDDFGALAARSSEAESEYERLSAEESAAKNAVSAREADLAEARLRLADKERELMEHQREVHRVESEVSRLEARAEVAVTQLAGLDEREERMRAEREQLFKEEAELTAQASTLKEEQRALKQELDALRNELAGLETAFQANADNAHEVESKIERERTRLFDIQAELSHNNNRFSRLEERRTGLEAAASKALEEERQTDEKLAELTLACEKKRMDLDALKASQAKLEDERLALTEELGNTREGLRALESELASSRELLSSKSSRLQSLKELEENLEGYGEGVKALISETRHGRLSGIRGVVADMLQAGPEHEKAIEALLGDALQHIIVEGHGEAKEALVYLKSGGFGRGTFIPVSPREHPRGGEYYAGEGAIGPALSLVKAKEGYEGMVGALLGRALVVRDLDTALGLWDGGADYTIATLDGEVLEPFGAMSGGGQGSGGVLSKKREIRELATEVEEITLKNQSAQDRLSESKAQAEGIETKLKGLAELIAEKRVAVVGAEKDYGALSTELDRVRKKLEVLGIESAQREQEAMDIQGESTSVRSALDVLKDEKLKKETDITARQDELKAAKSAMEAAREVLTFKKMDLSALIQKHESSARDIKRADLHRDELARRAARLDSEEKELVARREELTCGRKEAEEKINVLMREVLEMKALVPGLQDAYQEASESISALEESVKVTRRASEDARAALSDMELRRAELKIKMEHLVETVNHNYHIEIHDIDEGIKEIGMEREEAELNASEIKIKLERLGPVNIGAIEEYNELMERFNFLSSQKEDLEASVRKLRDAIGKINKTSEELFMEAFNAINETFKTVFLSLFGGGRAELQLTQTEEGGDVLDSGLEIVAQPPGKKLQSLMLCSGGEKALIAAALTFACFLVKPSPFCVLDEVDAPLDENNVQRFGHMLKDFSGQTQFIVITHSRPTMELADALYGVTMDEPGVSRLVSVRLKEDTELAGV